jgi:hypothetical protein
MSACPSRLALSHWEATPEGERPAELGSHLHGCVHCSAVIEDISSARALLLGSDPAEISRRAARTILAAARERTRKRRWLQWLAPVLLVPAAAALLLVAKPALVDRGEGLLAGGAVKGELVVETYCKRGSRVFPAQDGQEFLAGDRLRFAYTNARSGYLLVFAVDDRGAVFPYYPEVALVGTFAEAGARVLLPGSVELDGHQGWERIFALWSETQVRDDVVRSAIAAALARMGNDIRRVTTLDLPVEQVSMLLRRP